MNNTSQDSYKELMNIESEIENKLSDDNISDQEANFFQALRTVIHLKIDSSELQHKFEMFNEVFAEMAIGNFDHRLNIPNRKNLFTHMGTSVNAVLDELKINVVKKQYLETALEFIPHIAIVTDKAGVILFVNSVAEKSFNKDREYFQRLIIANIFENKMQFGMEDPDFNAFEDVPVSISFLDQHLNICLTVKEIFNRLGQLDGYLYIGKVV